MSDLRYYWAYGSNLSVKQMQKRCPGAVKVGALYVHYGRLRFRGVADVIGSRKSTNVVPGGLWLITAKHEAMLDRCEGVGFERGYSKMYLDYTDKNRVKHDCLFYKKKHGRGVMPPAQYYLDYIAEGYRDFGLEMAYLDEALAHSHEKKNVTPELRWRRKRDRYARLAAPPSFRKARYALGKTTIN
jgi:hypothetical protein